jgi:hypothetical protein
VSIRHPGCKQLESPTSSLWSRILWRLMPRETRQALKEVAAENARLVKQQSDRERHFISSRQSLCEQSDKHEARANELQKKLDWIGPMNTALADAHEEAVKHRNELESRALPGFTDIVKTGLPS